MAGKKRPTRPDSESSQEEILAYLDYSFEHDDLKGICRAIGDVTKLFDIPEIARISGVRRESVYRAFGGSEVATLTTIVSVLSAMGFGLGVKQVRRSPEIARRRTERNSASA
ncbi:helix-turn-helix domain-containing transcriptional regulator [Bradyrhizobium sp. USDA 10063]